MVPHLQRRPQTMTRVQLPAIPTACGFTPPLLPLSPGAAEDSAAAAFLAGLFPDQGLAQSRWPKILAVPPALNRLWCTHVQKRAIRRVYAHDAQRPCDPPCAHTFPQLNQRLHPNCPPPGEWPTRKDAAAPHSGHITDTMAHSFRAKTVRNPPEFAITRPPRDQNRVRGFFSAFSRRAKLTLENSAT